MLRGALITVVLVAGGAQAQPAAPADVDAVLDRIGVGRGTLPHGDSAVLALQALLPGFDGFSADQRGCAEAQLAPLLEGQVRSNIISHLGDDGAADVAQWQQFLATPAGHELSLWLQAFQAGDARSAVSDDPALQAQAEAFVSSAPFLRFLQGPRAAGLLTEAFAVQLAEQVQRHCLSSTRIEKIS